MARIPVAVIGCGGMAGSHASRFDRLSSRLRITATADIDLAKAEALASRFPGAQPIADYRQVLDTDAQAVLIALPHHLHRDAVVACLDAGKHVLVEKPMANTEQECLDMIEAARRADRVLMVAYCMRFHPLVIHMKELIDEKAYGDVFQVSIWTEQHTEREPEHWMCRSATVGGGQLFSHGCHYIDILLWYLGNPLYGCHMGTNRGTPWMEREGTSHVCIHFENGALGYHFGTWGAKGSRLKYSFHAHCDGGMIEAAISEKRLLAHTPSGEKLLMELEESGKHTEREMAHFLDCIESGETPFTSPEQSLQGLRVIWRMYEAEEKNIVADLRGLGLTQG